MAFVRQGRHVVTNGIRLHYIRLGKGKPPLVLIPGITSPAISWQFVGERLAEDNDVYILDNRGRGLSQGGPDLRHRLDDYARDTEGLVRGLGLDRPAIVGHSMGGRIAVRLAALAPDCVGKLVLVDPPVSGPGRRPYPLPIDWYLDSIERVSRGEGFEEMKKALPWSEEHLELRMEWLPTCDRTAIIESHKSFHEEEIHSDLPRIRSDTLLIYAEKGGTISESDADELVHALKNGRKQRIDGAGHMIPWDKLDAFVSAVRSFVAH
jgi:N-formylmaleamate deformylase